MITWVTHASAAPGGKDLPNLNARRAIRARRAEAEASLCWMVRPRYIIKFLKFKLSPTWGLLAVYQVGVEE